MAKKEKLNEENLDTGAEGAEGTEQKVDLEVAIRAAFDAGRRGSRGMGGRTMSNLCKAGRKLFKADEYAPLGSQISKYQKVASNLKVV